MVVVCYLLQTVSRWFTTKARAIENHVVGRPAAYGLLLEQLGCANGPLDCICVALVELVPHRQRSLASSS